MRRERVAVGIFDSGSSVGGAITALVIPVIAMVAGWRSAFVVAGLVGFLWLALWLRMYHPPESDPDTTTEGDRAGSRIFGVPPWSVGGADEEPQAQTALPVLTRFLLHVRNLLETRMKVTVYNHQARLLLRASWSTSCNQCTQAEGADAVMQSKTSRPNGKVSQAEHTAQMGSLALLKVKVPSKRLLCAVKKGSRIVPVRAVGDWG